MFRILITGSRDWPDIPFMREALRSYTGCGVKWCHGGARGADSIAAHILREFSEDVKAYPVDTSIDGPWPAAGNRRNERMFNDFKPDLVLAFPMPQSKGTVNMIAYAEKHGCPVIRAVMDAV